jgi:phosphate transport system substrate-binding protein
MCITDCLSKGRSKGKFKKEIYVIFGFLVLSIIIIIASCKTEIDDIDQRLKIIEGFTFENYPKVDGSTSTEPLSILMACKLLGIRHEWYRDSDRIWRIRPILNSQENFVNFQRVITTSQTHQSFINLIDKEADIILTARMMSLDEKAYANTKGVSLIETPIALDAFVFIVNPNNPITTLTIGQIQDIYTGKITNWNEVGGNDAPIYPYVRNPNSGSQELMESLVMKDLNMIDLPISHEIIFSMGGVFEYVQSNINAICFTVFFYKENILRDVNTKTIAIEGINPSKENIINGSYPLVTEVFAVIRSDLDRSSMAYKLYELLQTELGKQVISESGYIPN